MGLRFDYPAEFEALWKAHPFGVKKLGYDAWRKLKLDAAENKELLDHIIQRHKDDEKWLGGVFVPHLSSFLNGRRWEDAYKRIWRRESQAVPGNVWELMGYENEAAYIRGERRH